MVTDTSSAIKHIAVLTSGGDAPGMNAAIRSIVLTARYHGIQVTGFYHGYNGLIDNEYLPLNSESVKNIIDIGGTILKSARCQAFFSPDGIKKAAKTLQQHNVDCLIVIGGDGSFRGAIELEKVWQKQVIGVPGTIDNDIAGTDATIGYYTAIETALDAIDKIRDTADAFERIFLVEVMGRHAGFIALNSAIGSGAEQVVLPELYINQALCEDQLVEQIKQANSLKGNSSYIIVIAENIYPHGTHGLAEFIQQQTGLECRPCILGYIQRGGRPVAQDRILATRLGACAVEQAISGNSNIMLAEQNHHSICIPLSDATDNDNKPLDDELLTIQEKFKG